MNPDSQNIQLQRSALMLGAVLKKQFIKLHKLIVLLVMASFLINAIADTNTLKSNVQKSTTFEDTPTLFPIKRMPDIGYTTSGVAWMDASHVMIGVKQFGQWQAGEGELSKIIILDTSNGNIEETPYRGYLMCYKPERMLVCPSVISCTDMHSERGRKYGTPYLIGKNGDALQQMLTFESHKGLDEKTCERYPPDENLEKTVDDVTVRAPLGPNAGYVGYGAWDGSQQKFALLNQDLQIYWQMILHDGCEHTLFHYNSWDDSYFAGSNFAQSNAQSTGNCAYKHRVFLIKPKQTSVRVIEIPDPIESWLKDHQVGVSVAWSIRGLLLFTSSEDIHKQGLFLVNESGHIKRLIAKRYIEMVDVAPDGCHVLIQHYQGLKPYMGSSPFERKVLQRTFETSVINMCEGE